MELIYKNNYGACYKIVEAPNRLCKIQLVVDSIGIFMSEADLEHLLEIVRQADEPCFCPECNGAPSKKIWSTGPYHDICLKVDDGQREEMEDLIVGTQFVLNIDDTLSQYRID